jgi:methyl-accepting chemotaxis protein
MLKKINGLSISTKVVAIAMVSMLMVVAINYVFFMNGYRKDVAEGMNEKAAAFTAVADEAKNHTSKMLAVGAVDVHKLADEAEVDLAAGKRIDQLKLFKAIPVVAGWTAAGEAAKREGIDFKVPAFKARNKNNEPESGSFRATLLSDLEKQVSSGGADRISRVNTDTNTLHYMRAIRLEESCMMCHGDPNVYGRKLADGSRATKDVLGFAMEGWKVGDMHGAYEVAMPLATLDKQVAGFFTNGLMLTAGLAAAGSIAMMLLVRAFVSRPIGQLVERVKDIATGDGDLTKRIGLDREDEIGILARYTDQFISKVHDIMCSVAGSAAEVATAATEVAASSDNIAKNMEQQSAQIAQAAAAVEEMSSSANTVSQRSGDAVTRAKSAGESATRGANSMEQTVGDMTAINDAVASSANIVTGLGKRGEQIGEVIAVINDIADQTNLLALNAAIEAARAGEHGRGFAVVADEVRKLAERTTASTQQIVDSINAIRTETGRAVQEINGGAEQVKAGVTRAKVAGQEIQTIVRSSQEVTDLIDQIAACTREQSTACQSAAAGIDDVRRAAQEAAAAANQSATASSELSSKSEQLDSLVRKFKLNRRDASRPNTTGQQRRATDHAGEFAEAGAGGPSRRGARK